jgi:hypothetical protein
MNWPFPFQVVQLYALSAAPKGTTPRHVCAIHGHFSTKLNTQKALKNVCQTHHFGSKPITQNTCEKLIAASQTNIFLVSTRISTTNTSAAVTNFFPKKKAGLIVKGVHFRGRMHNVDWNFVLVLHALETTHAGIQDVLLSIAYFSTRDGSHWTIY